MPVFDDIAGIDLSYLKDFIVCEEILCFFKAKELLNTELDLIGLFEQPNSQPLVHIQPRADLLNQFVQLNEFHLFIDDFYQPKTHNGCSWVNS